MTITILIFVSDKQSLGSQVVIESVKSQLAIYNVNANLEVVSLGDSPERAETEGVICTPTIVAKVGEKTVRLVGSDSDRDLKDYLTTSGNRSKLGSTIFDIQLEQKIDRIATRVVTERIKESFKDVFQKLTSFTEKRR
jgi:hypothetical protein